MTGRSKAGSGGGDIVDDLHWGCVDCGVNTPYTDDYYMVRDDVWAAAIGFDKLLGELLGCMLFLRCLARRFGRRLEHFYWPIANRVRRRFYRRAARLPRPETA
jgi:hypothetical protein